MEVNNNIILNVGIERAGELEGEIIQLKAIIKQQNNMLIEKDKRIKELENQDSK